MSRPLCFLFLALLCTFVMVSCSNPKGSEEFNGQVRIRLDQDPDRLNPILSATASAAQIEPWLFNSLQTYDPITMEMSPVLLEAAPEIKKIINASGEEVTQLDFRIRKEARWDNGDPVTGHDYLFTMKACLVPGIDNSSWSSFITQFTSILVDPNDDRRITVQAKGAYMQIEEIVTGFPVYPEYFYDPNGLLKENTFEYLLNVAKDSVVDQNLQAFAKMFNSTDFSRDKVSGSGAYELVEWKSQQSILLQRKADWWGTDISQPNTMLRADPKEIIYYIIADEQTALTSLKDGALDLVSDLTPSLFQELKEYKSSAHPLQLHSPAILQYLYIACNTERPALSDAFTRRALAHLIDIDLLVEELFYNEAQPVVSPIHPSKQYYAKDLKPYAYSIEMAKNLLAEAGWGDQNQDGILDRTKNGSRVDFRLNINTTRSQLGQDVATLLKQSAAQVGVSIELVSMDTRAMLQEVRSGNYDMACLAARPPAGDFDPYPNWHSASRSANGNNTCNYANEELDRTIEAIRTASDGDARAKLYHRFQEILHEEQPALFLVAPSNRIAMNAAFQIITGSLKPGYFENTAIPF